MFDYEAACDKATTDQGLDQIVSALIDAEMEHGIEQTGGFCMVVTVPRASGVWAITNENHAVRDEPLCGWYPGTAWREGDSENVQDFDVESIDAMLELVQTSPAK